MSEEKSKTTSRPKRLRKPPIRQRRLVPPKRGPTSIIWQPMAPTNKIQSVVTDVKTKEDGEFFYFGAISNLAGRVFLFTEEESYLNFLAHVFHEICVLQPNEWLKNHLSEEQVKKVKNLDYDTEISISQTDPLVYIPIWCEEISFLASCKNTFSNPTSMVKWKLLEQEGAGEANVQINKSL